LHFLHRAVIGLSVMLKDMAIALSNVQELFCFACPFDMGGKV
jgi:hypothetical protein